MSDPDLRRLAERLLGFAPDEAGVPRVQRATDELLGAVYLLDLGPEGDDFARLDDALSRSPRAVNLFRMILRASTLEGMFAPFEGKRTLDPEVPEGFATPAGFWSAWGDRLNALADAKPRSRRYTPFGTHTDDSQYAMAGIRAGLRGGGSPVEAIFDEWTAWGRQDAWRGIGRRTRGFLQRGRAELSGEATLGDLLRATSVFLAGHGLFPAYADAVGLTPEQCVSGRRFITALNARLGGDVKSLRDALQELGKCHPPHEGRKSGLFPTVVETLLANPDPRAFAAGLPGVGADYDTYGYLAGLFASDAAIPLHALPRPNTRWSASVVAHALLAASREAGCPVNVPESFAFETMEAERACNRLLAEVRGG